VKFLLIFILQEPKEFGVTTSHMLVLVVPTNVHTWFFAFFSLQARPPEAPKLDTFQTFITLVVSVISSLKLLFLSFT
jgi:hypothetical protein